MCNLNKRYEIQVLRFLAVFFVIFGHLNLLQFRSGYLGVDVFFVISGFLITGILFKPDVTLLSFYSRRVKRIAPLALLVITAVSIFSFIYYNRAGNEFTLKDSLFASFSVINFELSHRAGDYFLLNNSTSLFQHFWSLGIEEQFYLFWPLFILFLIKKLRKAVSILLVSLMLLSSLAYFALVMEANSTVGYYNSLGRVWELMLGALVAVIGVKLKPKKAHLVWVGGCGVLILLSLQSNEYSLIAYVLVGIIVATLLAVELPVTKSNLVKPLVYLGDISYGLYLWHWPIWLVMEREFGDSLAIKLMVILLTLIFAMLSNKLLEKKAIRSSLKPEKTIVVFLVSLILLSSINITVAKFDNSVNVKEVLSEINQSSKIKNNKEETGLNNNNNSIGDGLGNNGSSINPGEGNNKGSTSQERFPSYTDIFPALKSMNELGSYLLASSKKDYTAVKIKQDIGKIREDIGYFSQDHCPVATTSCTLEVKERKELYLLGDSHANMWFPALARLEEYGEYRVSSLAIPGCPAVAMAFEEGYKEMGKEKYNECQKTLQNYIAAIKRDKPEVLVITGGTQTGKISWIKRYPALISELKPFVGKIIFIGDFVYGRVNVVECLQNYSSIKPYECGQATSQLDPGYTDRIELEEKIIQKTGIFYYNPESLMCNEQYCPAVLNDIIVYRDRFHITRTYARWVGELLLKELKLL